MPRGPRVHEIFSNSALDKSTAFSFDKQENVQQIKLTKKNAVMAPDAPMKRFGAYKPKILSTLGQEDNQIVENKSGIPLDKAVLTRKVSPDHQGPSTEQKPRVALTKPKPFVIGDKDVPMVLSTVGDNDDPPRKEDVNGNLEDEIDDLHIYNTVIENEDHTPSMSSLQDSDDTNTLISPSTHIDNLLGFENPALVQGDESPVSGGHLPMSESDSSTVTSANIFLSPEVADSFNKDSGNELDDVYIPHPDYDEDEQSMVFSDEELSDENSPRRRQLPSRPRPDVQNDRPLTHMYEGEDLSHYLSDDESPADPGLVETKKNKKGASKTLPRPQKLNDRHSMFKPPPPTYTKGRKGSSKMRSPGFNSVRSFSYADSKCGTVGKAKGSTLHGPDESQQFLNGGSSYESFLRVRHGDTIPLPDSSDSGVDMDDGGTLWKKLTLRFKNK